MVRIVVPNVSAHGIPSKNCATRLRNRLENHEIIEAQTPTEELALVRDADVYVGNDLSEPLLEAAENLRLFACASAGVGHLDLSMLRDQGVVVTNASGIHGPCIAEHVIGWMLMITRRLDEGLRRQSRREWRHFPAMGELKGSRVCVVGLGAIGKATVQRLEGFEVETVGVRYSPEKGGPTDSVYGFDEIEDALVGSDYVIIVSPLTEETEELIGARELDILQPRAVLINAGRGGIVNTEALVAALRDERLHAAALDVTDPEPLPESHPLWTFDNVFITPHNAGHTPPYWERIADILVRNLEQVRQTGEYKNLENQVN